MSITKLTSTVALLVIGGYVLYILLKDSWGILLDLLMGIGVAIIFCAGFYALIWLFKHSIFGDDEGE
jgi:hypothetical protein